MRGVYKSVLRFAFQGGDEQRHCRAWKLYRFERFFNGDWTSLLTQEKRPRVVDVARKTIQSNEGQSVHKMLVAMGEISSGRGFGRCTHPDHLLLFGSEATFEVDRHKFLMKFRCLINPAVERATAPFQHALTTRAGVEHVVHVIQTLTDLDHAVYSLFCRLSGTFGRRRHCAPICLPVPQLCFHVHMGGRYGSCARCRSGRRWEQGDPLIPALFALEQHRVLAVRERLRPDEHLLALLDDVNIVCRPGRVVHIHAMLRAQLWHHTRIQIHQGKTLVEPANIQFVQQDALIADPDPGVVILGTPLGHSDFVQRHVQSKVESHRVLLERIFAVLDLQAGRTFFSVFSHRKQHESLPDSTMNLF